MENVKEFDVTKYPEGYEQVKEELLDFLPEGADKAEFLKKYVILMMQR